MKRREAVGEVPVKNEGIGGLFLGFLEDGFDGVYDGVGVFVVEVLGVDHELVFGVFEHEPGLVEGFYAGVSVAEPFGELCAGYACDGWV